MKKILLFSVLTILLFSCSSDDSNSTLTDIEGYYKIVSIKSDKALDLNNDGVVSADFYSEISGLYNAPYGEKLSFFDFESSQNFMELRPTENQDNNAQLIDFRFPHQYIDYLGNEKPFLREYLKSLINYTYTINNSNDISLENGFTEEVDKVGEVLSLEIINNDFLKATIVKNTFDFKTKEWQKVNLVVDYKKVKN